MPTALAVRHVHFEDLGLLETLLRARGFEIAYAEPWAGLPPDVETADLVVLLGGPISVNDVAAYPFVEGEIELARRRIAANRPLLGICLGAQLMTRAIGGTVAPGPAKEIGWAPLTLSEAGRHSPLAALEGLPVLHWHGEACAPPTGIPALASTPLCPFQAFRPGPAALALQFHVEAGATGDIEPWLVGHTLEIELTPGASVAGLRADTARHGPALAKAADALFGQWLAEVGLATA